MKKIVIILIIFHCYSCKNDFKDSDYDSIKIVELARQALDKTFQNIKLRKKVEGFPAQSNGLIHYDIPKTPLCQQYYLKNITYYKDNTLENWDVYFYCPKISNSEVSVNIYRWAELIMKGLPYKRDYKVREVMFGRMKYKNLDGSICQEGYIECMQKAESKARKFNENSPVVRQNTIRNFLRRWIANGDDCR